MAKYTAFCGKWELKGKISDVSDIKLRSIKSQYGLVGYSIQIEFKDGSQSIQIWQELGDNVMGNIEELSQFCLGRST